ncbi:MAG: IPT/TIG domain-containing protein [Terriglobia bacterium]
MRLRHNHNVGWLRNSIQTSFAFFALLIVVASTPAQNPNPLFFADIAHGGTTSPYQTTVQLFNASSQDVTATISIYLDNGTPFNVGLTDGQGGATLTPTSPGVFSVTIPARGLKLLTTSGSQDLQSGWMQVTSPSSSLNGNVVFQQVDGNGNLLTQSGVPNSAPMSSVTGVFEKSATVNTGIALANPSSTTTLSVTVQLTGANGLVILNPYTLSLGPLQHIAQFPDQFPPFANVGNTLGTIAISASGNIVATFLRLERGQLTTLPSFAGTALVPTITGISPASGNTDTTITISGANFDGSGPANNQVTFNGVNGSVVSATASTLVVTVPSGIPAGTIPVVVTANGGSSNSFNFTVNTGFDVPVITSLNPAAVLAGSPSTIVTINGKNFATTQQGASVQLKDQSGNVTSPPLLVVNSTQATITLTSDQLTQAATFSLTYVNPNRDLITRNLSNTVQFQVANQIATLPPTITSVNPSSAGVGQPVTITGSNFDPVNTGNNVVMFNGVRAIQVTVSSNGTQITAPVPPGATTGPVTVTTGGLVSNSFLFTVLGASPLRKVTVGNGPARVAFDPVLNQAIVTNSIDNSVTFVDVANAVSIKTISTGGENPIGIAIFGRLGLVANFAQFSKNKTVTVLNLDSQSLQGFIDVTNLSGSPLNVAIDTAAGNALVTDSLHHVGVLNLVTRQVIPFFESTPYDIAVYNPLPNVDWAVITDSSEGKLIIYDLQQNQQVAAIPVGMTPQGVAINASTGIAVVANAADDTVSLVDLNALKVVGTITLPAGSRPVGVAVNASRNRAVVTNNTGGSISVIDLATKSLVATLPTGGSNPQGVAIDEAAGLAIVANQGSNTVSIVALP